MRKQLVHQHASTRWFAVEMNGVRHEFDKLDDLLQWASCHEYKVISGYNGEDPCWARPSPKSIPWPANKPFPEFRRRLVRQGK